MALEIGKDIHDQEGTSLRQLFWGQSAAVVHDVNQGRGGGEQAVENALHRVGGWLHVGDATVVLDLPILHGARGATDAVEHAHSTFRGFILLEERWSEG